ncbi:MAG: carboxypeptidase-like regulatory domain-containing protein [Chloroflexota bacterium]
MVRSRLSPWLLLTAALLAPALACSLPGVPPSPTTVPAATGVTPEALPSEVVDTAVVPPESPTPAPTPTPTIVHLMRPSEPGLVDSFMTDLSTEPYAPQRRSNVDNFDWNNYERPYTSEVMDYVPYLDLIRAELSADAPWIYVTLFLEEAPPPGAAARYALEFDLDLDGRGDWLITALLPPGSEWTTDGVRAYTDTNNDVGGPHPLRADPPPQPTDGYDRLVFDQGVGDDPDAAWVRRSPTNNEHVQIAFKHALIAFDNYLLWGAWVDEGSYDPAWFDYNDHFSAAEAGSAFPPSEYYPVRQLASLDNTCRWAFDFTPAENLPGMCALPPTPTPVPNGSISGVVYRGFDTVTTERFAGAQVLLGMGACPSTGFASSTTASDGTYTFTHLPAGQYCVTVVNGSLQPPATYGWDPTSPNFPNRADPYRGVTLGTDEAKTGINFGFMETIG